MKKKRKAINTPSKYVLLALYANEKNVFMVKGDGIP